ncbi:MAG: HlyD family efflux transporter periplasmic adaptor subunit [Candidatus Cloacimonetes bacterium]|nr:HlyD family efflux transporter periplasmic adaptor subunit [Candidatus Cloacimonadota bacterium]
MKAKQKIHILFIISLAVIISTVIVSYQIEARSQKLPAVVRAEKVYISTMTEGTMGDSPIVLMQEVVKSDVIAHIENNLLSFKLDTLRKEKEQYEALITSAQSGDKLTLELNKLEEDILENRLELKETELELATISEKLKVSTALTQTAARQYQAQKALLAGNLISNGEFQKEADKYFGIMAKYEELRNDSLYAAGKITTLSSMIDLLSVKKGIINSNVSILASDYLIDLDKVYAEINYLEDEINNLTVISPVTGVVTDINFRPGEKVKKGDVIAEIADLSNIWLTAYGNSFSRHSIEAGNAVTIYCENGKDIYGKVISISPVMEKVKALSSTFETTNAYTKVEIAFDDMQKAQQYLTPGERLFVRIKLGKK